MKHRFSHLAAVPLVAALAAAPLVSHSGTDVISDPACAAGRLEERVWHLRSACRYEGAVAAADSLLALLESDPALPASDLQDARRLLETVKLISGLSERDRRDLARADSLDAVRDRLHEEGRYEAAEEVARRQLETRGRLLGESHPDVAVSLHDLARAVFVNGDHETAVRLASEAHRVRRAVLGERHPLVIESAVLLGGAIRVHEGPEMSLDVLEEAGDISKVALEVGHPARWYAARSLATSYAMLAMDVKADSLVNAVLAEQARLNGEESAEYYSSIKWAGDIRRHQGRFGDSVELYRRAAEGLRVYHAETAKSVTSALHNLAYVLMKLGEYEQADHLYREVMELYERGGRGHSFDMAALIHGYGCLLDARGRPLEGIQFIRRAIDIYEELAGRRNTERISATLLDLAVALVRAGRFEESEAICREVIETNGGYDQPETYYVREGLRLLSSATEGRGDLEEAERQARRYLEIQRGWHGDARYELLRPLGSLANYALTRGDYVEAEMLYRHALEIARATGDEKSVGMMIMLGSLAGIRRARGDYEEAEGLCRESLALAESVDQHLRVSSALVGLSRVYLERGDLQAAEEAAARATAVIRENYGDEHHWIPGLLVRRADVLWAAEDREGAESCLREALTRREALGLGASLSQSYTLGRLSAVLLRKGSLEDAATTARRAAQLQRSVGGEGFPFLWVALAYEGRAALGRGLTSEAAELLEESARLYDLARLDRGTGEERMVGTWSPHSYLAHAHLLEGRVLDAWKAVERSSARTLADLLLAAERRELTAREQSEEDSLRFLQNSLEQQLKVTREAAARDTSRGFDADADRIAAELECARAEWSRHEQAVASRYPATEGQPYALEKVQEPLGDREAVVGWLDLDVDGQGHATWGYVVRSGGPVAWFRLPTSDDTSLADDGLALREALTDPSSSATGAMRLGRSLFRERVEPLLPALEGVSDLVVVPSGPMLGVPVEVVVSTAGGVFADTWTVSYVPSATVYTWLAERELPRGERALLAGDPIFSENDVVAEAGDEPAVDAGSVESAFAHDEAVVLRGAASGNRSALSALPRLTGSLAEVRTISRLLPDPLVLAGPDADEREIVRLTQSGELAEFGVVHVATHALVNDEDPSQSALVLSQVGLPDPIEAALAGERIYDGLLTAREIVAEFDLDADLVTLSACETGLGKKMVGEGYVGLAQALLRAGAQSVVVSLWKVDDRATALLMQRFYEDYSGRYEGERAGYESEPIPKAAALAEAKEWLRSYEDERGRRPYEHPYYWSAFILIGARE